MAPSCPLCESQGPQSEIRLGGAEITDYQVRGLWGSKRVSFLSGVIPAHWMCRRILGQYASVFICVLSGGGIHPCAAYCVRGHVNGINSDMREDQQESPFPGIDVQVM